MASNSDGHVTSIDSTYLNKLVQDHLQPLLDEVNQMLQNGRSEAIPGIGGNAEVPPIDGTLSVPAGANSFEPANHLINALGKVGSSVNADLNWFQRALSDTIDEVKTTVSTMKKTDSLNAEQAQTLMQDFTGVMNDVSSSPTSSSGGSGGSGGGSGSGSGGGSGSGSGSGSKG